MVTSEVVKASVNPRGKKIVTFLWTYPRFIHSEIMTHRMFSRNAASSRAIPVDKMIQAIEDDPAMPEWWGKNQKGMQAGEQLDEFSIDNCKKEINLIKDVVIGSKYKLIDNETYSQLLSLTENKHEDLDYSILLEIKNILEEKIKTAKGVKGLNIDGLHKQTSNRYIEPWMHMTVLVTATEWDNFFALRAHPAAQPEFQTLAYKALDQYLNIECQELDWDEWHIPFRDNVKGDEKDLISSVASCARTSYTKHNGDFTHDEQKELYNRLSKLGHWSPFEHQAQAQEKVNISGNFRNGWLQYRNTFENENRSCVNLAKLLDSKPDWIKL